MMFAYSGYGTQFLWPDSPAVQQLAPKVLMALTIITGVLFGRRYYQYTGAPAFRQQALRCRVRGAGLWLRNLPADKRAVRYSCHDGLGGGGLPDHHGGRISGGGGR